MVQIIWGFSSMLVKGIWFGFYRIGDGLKHL